MPTESVKIPNFIDGQFVEPVGGKYLDNIEPATGKPYSFVPDSDARDVDLAVESAALLVELENRARHRGREHGYCQTKRTHSDDRVPALRDLYRSRPAEWRSQCSPRHWPKRRRRHHRASEDRHDLVYRRD